jgi:hypothetical protein
MTSEHHTVANSPAVLGCAVLTVHVLCMYCEQGPTCISNSLNSLASDMPELLLGGMSDK